MILKGIETTRYFARPDPSKAGLLIFGADAMRVALKRAEVIAALIGPDGPAEMRLTRIAGAALRKEPALLLDATKAIGFFPGARVAFVEEATDGLAPVIASALEAWRPGDAQVIVTAGALTAKSALKVLFDKHPQAWSAGLYDDPPSREEIEAALKAAGLGAIDPAALASLNMLGRALDPGDFRQVLEKVALYKWGDSTPLTAVEVEAMAPATIETEVEDVVAAVADGRVAEIGPLMTRLEGQGTQPVTICIRALMHFRVLHAAACDPSGSAMARARVSFRAKEAMERQARVWGAGRLEEALTALIDCDLVLRSSSRAPLMAVMQRTLIRLARMPR
ncbi:MAG: DNA polymerase III subunit delta [Rhodobacteraceae bacterium]|nr:DNA polymerase III subunit delta [Paracoccaceae bacterium]